MRCCTCSLLILPATLVKPVSVTCSWLTNLSCAKCHCERSIMQPSKHFTWFQKWDDHYTFTAPPPPPPNSFDFKSPDKWLWWKQRFQQFRLASGLSTEDQERQVCILLYSMGDEAEDIPRSTSISEDKRKVNMALERFDQFFKVHKNVIFKRAKFNQRCQRYSESTKQFITSLYCWVTIVRTAILKIRLYETES